MTSNQFEKVAGILQRASYSKDAQERLDCLRQVRELIINHDRSLLDSFFEEVVAFQHYPSTDIKKFIIKFIEDACMIDGTLIRNSVSCLSHVFNFALHADPPLSSLLRSSIATLGPLYCRALTRAVKLGFIESGSVTGAGIESGSLADISLENFRAVIALKDEVVRLLMPGVVAAATPSPADLSRFCSTISDAARIDIIKFIEVIIVQQSRRMPSSELVSKTKEITLDQIPDMPNSLLKSIIDSSTAASSTTQLPGICLIRPRRLADEAERLISGLANLPLKQGDENVQKVITSSVFDAIIDCLVSVARQRPQFLDKALQSFETVHVNLPPHFTQAQVGLVRQKLKSALLCFLRHPTTTSDFQSRIIILLTDLGATQHEIAGVLGLLRHPPPPPTLSSLSKKFTTDYPIELKSQGSVSTLSGDPTVNDMVEFSGKGLPEALSFRYDDDDDDDENEEEFGKKQEVTSPSMRDQKRPHLPKQPHQPAKKQKKMLPGGTSTDTIPGIEEIANSLVAKLTTANVADLVLLSMVTLPSQMPATFNATYTPIAAAGTATQVRHLARLLAAQLVVWFTEEKGANTESRALLSQLLEEPTAAGDTATAPSATKKSSGRLKKTKFDEDDEAAFMKEHAARVHSIVKPMNISVVGRSADPGGSLLSPSAVGPSPVFNPTVPPPSFNPAIQPLMSLVPPPPPQSSNSITAPARPFSLDSVVLPQTVDLQPLLGRDAYLRILCADSDRSRTATPPAGESLRPTGVLGQAIGGFTAMDTARIKLLCRLPSRRFASGNLYSLLINHAMQNLKRGGFEILSSLLMHEYACFRGFMVAGILDKDEDQDNDHLAVPKVEETEETRLLIESQRQLRALQAQVRDDDDDDDEMKSEGAEDANTPSQPDSLPGATLMPLSSGVTNDAGAIHCEELGSFASYDNLFTNVLNCLSDAGVKETYLGRLLLEAPLLTPSAIEVLKRYCGVSHQAPYGFQVLRNLIELRQTDQRKDLLDLLLSFCSTDELAIRKAALRAACQLADSHKKWEKQIEDYAEARLKMVLQPAPSPEMFDTLLLKPTTTTPAQWTEETCQACAHLLLGLMPRNPGKLLLTFAEVYVCAGDTVRRSLLRLVDSSICAIGLHSPHLLNLIENCPPGAETLVTRMVHILTDPRTAFSHIPTKNTSIAAAVASVQSPVKSPLHPPVMPPAALVERIRQMYLTRVHDVRCLIPVIVGLTKQEVIAALPKLIQLNERVLKEVISRLLHASVSTLPAPDPRHPCLILVPNESVVGPVTPEELLVAIHLLEFVTDPNAAPSSAEAPAKPYIELRLILQACLHCFAERQLYTQERLSATIGQLLDRPVLPTLFLRTVMQALALYPRLAGYVINVLFRLIQKQVWKSPVLWDGFIRCCVKTQPQSYQVLLQLPPQQLQSVFVKEPNLRAQVRRYVDNFSSAQRTHISRAVFDVLNREFSPSKPPVATTAAVEKSPVEKRKAVSSGHQPSEVCEHVEAPANDAQSSGSATPVRDEVESKVVNAVESPGKQDEKEGYQDCSMSPPAIVTSKSAQKPISVLTTADVNADADATSYSPPVIQSSRVSEECPVSKKEPSGTASKRSQQDQSASPPCLEGD